MKVKGERGKGKVEGEGRRKGGEGKAEWRKRGGESRVGGGTTEEVGGSRDE